MLSAGCMVWSRPQTPASQDIKEDAGALRVTKIDHSVVVVTHAAIRNDSIIGVATDGTGARVSLPITDVQGVAKKELSPGRTLALGGGIVLASLGVLAILLLVAVSNTNY